MGSEDMWKVLKTAMLTGTGPDIAYTDVGPGDMGLLARSDLLYNLTEVYDKYGWNERLFSYAKELCVYDGVAWGFGNELEYIGTYYNKDGFSELGVHVPKTYNELTSIADKAKSAGYIPFGFACRDHWTLWHPFSLMMNLLVPRDELENILRIWGVDFLEKGYFPDSPNALKYGDGNMLFYTGKALMRYTGTWLVPTVLTNVKTFEPGFFVFPKINPDIPPRPPTGYGSGYCVSKTTKFPEQCFEYLDYLLSQEAGKIWIEDAKIIPPFQVEELPNLDLAPLQKNVIQEAYAVDAGYYVDFYSTSTLNNELSALFQGILGGKITVEEAISKLNSIWREDRKEGELRSFK